MDNKKDIWTEGIRSIMSYIKRSLLDYVDAIDRQSTSQQEKERLGKIKGRIHNDVSQGELMVGILFQTMKSGGDISAFENDLLRSPNNRREGFRGKSGTPPLKNPVLKEEYNK